MDVLIYLNYICVFYIVAYPICLCLAMIVYCVTREQMMLQVDMVRHRVGAELVWEKSLPEFLL